MTGSKEERIASQRDIVANQLTEMNIYRSVVENIMSLNEDPDIKVDLLFQSVPDLAIIIAQLSLCKSRGLISYDQYADLSNRCLLKLNKSKKFVEFNPINMNNGA